MPNNLDPMLSATPERRTIDSLVGYPDPASIRIAQAQLRKIGVLPSDVSGEIVESLQNGEEL